MPSPEYQEASTVNNILNSEYRILSWKVHIALIKAKLEPYLGFLHCMEFGLPSLVCDFEEPYRYLVDNFVIQYCRKLRKKDFSVKRESFSFRLKGQREYLKKSETRSLIKSLNQHFQTRVSIPRIRMGNHQELETLINEEALLLAKYLRNERQSWNPRTTSLTQLE